MSVRRLVPSRESVTTIRRDGSRFFLHPADTQGRFTFWRRVMACVLIGLYVALPWIPINGYPAVFLDTAHHRFHLFGLTLAVQDLWMFFFILTGVGFTGFVITSLFGRLWCGWACPQTVFLEHVYRRIERWIEGSAEKRKALDRAPWDERKVALRIIKHGLFLAVSVVIAHVFLSYFVSLPGLYRMMTHSPLQNLHSFVFVAAASGVFYFNFAWFREQLCLIICPYGRLQSALIDDHTVVIGYDSKRGEPRGKIHEEGVGHCVDCLRCVQVCPTGIDIRHGLQIECIGCANCIDACDEVMEKIGRPKGLVRYDSSHGLAGEKTSWIRPRSIMYAVLMLVGGVVALNAFSTFRPANLAVTRMVGAPYYVTEGKVRNQYLVRVVNKRNEQQHFQLKVQSALSGVEWKGFENGLTLQPMEEQVRPLIVQVPQGVFRHDSPIKIVIEFDGKTLERAVDFLGPDR